MTNDEIEGREIFAVDLEAVTNIEQQDAAQAEKGPLKQRLTLEQRAEIAALVEDYTHNDDQQKDLTALVKARAKNDAQKPAGEPPKIPIEERRAILEYYKNGATGEKPAHADRFGTVTITRTLLNPETGETTHETRHVALHDKAFNKWANGPAAKWIEKDRQLSSRISEIRYTIIDAATKCLLGLSFDEIQDNDATLDIETAFIYSEISTYTTELFGQRIDEIEAAYKERSATISAGLAKKRETEARTRELEAAATRELFKAPFVEMANNASLETIFSLSREGSDFDPLTQKTTWKTPTGKITLDGDFSKLTTNDRKLWDAGVRYLTKHNVQNALKPECKIILNIDEYAARRGRKVETPKQRDRFIADLRASVQALSKYSISLDIKRGRLKGKYADLCYVLYDSTVENDSFVFYVGPTIAQLLLSRGPDIGSGIMQYYSDLQKIQGTNPNAYPIARKLCVQSSNNNNIIRGTDGTISVKTLIECSGIPSFDSISREKTRRTWKTLIKAPIESALAKSEKIGLLSKWEYENPETKERYTQEQAATLTAGIYSQLNVNFTLKEYAPEAERKQLILENHAAREEQRALEAAAGKASKPRKKAPKQAQKADS